MPIIIKKYKNVSQNSNGKKEKIRILFITGEKEERPIEKAQEMLQQ